jgi:hypothetical protein
MNVVSSRECDHARRAADRPSTGRGSFLSELRLDRNDGVDGEVSRQREGALGL